VDVVARERFSDFEDRFGIRTRGRIQLEHRQATSFGLLRTVVRLEGTRDSGTALRGIGSGFAFNRDPSVSFNLTQAYIQFGGLTAGRVTSFFSNPDLPTGHMGTLRFDDAPDVALMAYTFDFGGRLLGHPVARGSLRPSSRLGSDRLTFVGFVAPARVWYAPGGFVSPLGIAYSGADMAGCGCQREVEGHLGLVPDLGALHEVSTQGTFGATGFGRDDEWGYAVRVTPVSTSRRSARARPFGPRRPTPMGALPTSAARRVRPAPVAASASARASLAVSRSLTRCSTR
jgi:hypothetical protein